eukprot:TRINITY_DN517_c0_g1_i2.p2 TRINITY_DN517_c0_g1~~TRINITY_DN517_c0_g1_i2.p2  ORF type:complete len:182 (-),score=86.06 TRINITY_DN517_c0_g1_i2:134-679(-)
MCIRDRVRAMSGSSYSYTDQGAHDSSGIRRADGNQYGCTAEQRNTMAELGLTLETAPKTGDDTHTGSGKNEWEDELIKHKVMDAPLDHKKMAFMLQMKREDEATLNPKNDLDDKDLDELLELEDDIDEKMFQKYRESRMAELMEQQLNERFGQLYGVKQDEYVREITEASKKLGDLSLIHI